MVKNGADNVRHCVESERHGAKNVWHAAKKALHGAKMRGTVLKM